MKKTAKKETETKGKKITVKEKNKILKMRAETLAQKVIPLKEENTQLTVVKFLMGSEIYGIDIHQVKRVHAARSVTSIPCTPPFVFGMMNFHGEVITVMDIRKFFDLPAGESKEVNTVIIVEADTMAVGILADSVVGIQAISLGDIQETLPTTTDRRADYVKGITAERLIILDTQKIVADKRLMINEQTE